MALALHGLCIEPEWLKIKHVRLSTKPKHRIVHITDLHHKGDRGYLENVIKQVNLLEPEIVCFTGDLVEDAEFLPESLDILSTIRAPLFGVPGNHDYWAGVDFGRIAQSFAVTGGKWLMDEDIVVADGRLQLIGATCSKAPSFDLQPGIKKVLLFHYPAWVEKLSGQSFDLMLAGHSHGGQVRLPFLGPLLVPLGVGDFDLGLYRTPSGPLYVNPGLGYFYLNVRLFCRPEITLIEI
jgi:predicted MPP superfamily phosphohydrolase